MTFASNETNVLLAPYVWKRVSNGEASAIEATMPGAYLKAEVQGTTGIGLVVDGNANNNCPPSSMPVIEYSIDQGPFTIVPLTQTGTVYTLPIANGLNPTNWHRCEIFFRASDLTKGRWRASTTHLRLSGLKVDRGGLVRPSKARAKRAIAFGDSITEGVGVDGLFTSWEQLRFNNSRATWFPFVAMALDCEYGQVGSGGLGMCNRKIEIPPLPESWDKYDAGSSRLVNGLLQPGPDYVFCELGTNDPGLDIRDDYARWLTALRKACGDAMVFCVSPPLGVHKAEVAAAVSARNQAGDSKVHLIDLASLESGFRAGQGATALAYDGVHPSVYGNAILGAIIISAVQKQITH